MHGIDAMSFHLTASCRHEFKGQRTLLILVLESVVPGWAWRDLRGMGGTTALMSCARTALLRQADSHEKTLCRSPRATPLAQLRAGQALRREHDRIAGAEGRERGEG